MKVHSRRRLTISGCILPFLLLAGMTATLVAQVNFGRISGTISDSSGAVVPGQQVRVTQEETGIERTVVSNERGDYIATNLPTGTYSVKVESAGFQPVARTGLTLPADGRLTVDFTLQLAGSTQIGW